jgi:dihydroxyacetone kinase
MTRVFDDPAAFADDAIAGFARAYRDHVVAIDGGVARAAVSTPGRVAVVIGGGSGHYPAFAGLVGKGLATGAACGKVFASPSAGQAYRLARAVDGGAGVLFSYGNYAGDRMQFGQAEQRLRSEGTDARTVVVTDDIASAPPERADERRGIAGGLAVFKIAGAAAEAGLPLDEVEQLARRANARARTLGVAFRGCTLPGAGSPLFTVPTGQMSIGLGIHGEPGVSDVAMPSARQLAELLVTKLLEERPAGATDRAVVLVNGLGTVKYEELFLLFGDVAALLAQRGVEVADAECGEFVTSLDMSGLSLTLFWVDDELEALWSAPADSPAFRKVDRPPFERRRVVGPTSPVAAAATPATAASVALARLAALALGAAAGAVHAHEQELGDLDAVAGDGDHGIGMCRGADGAVKAARAALDRHAGVHELLLAAGDEWSDSAGGTSGALWAAALIALASSLGNRSSYSADDLVNAALAVRDAIVRLGQAEVGDKTIVDALDPFVGTLQARLGAGDDLVPALQAAAAAATGAAAGTAPLRPRKGRARPLADRSVGTPDAGATSFALIAEALAGNAGQWATDQRRAGVDQQPEGAGPPRSGVDQHRDNEEGA